jgi:hypothetical protein
MRAAAAPVHALVRRRPSDWRIHQVVDFDPIVAEGGAEAMRVKIDVKLAAFTRAVVFHRGRMKKVATGNAFEVAPAQRPTQATTRCLRSVAQVAELCWIDLHCLPTPNVQHHRVRGKGNEVRTRAIPHSGACAS